MLPRWFWSPVSTRRALLLVLILLGAVAGGVGLTLGPRRAALATLWGFQEPVGPDLATEDVAPQHFEWTTDPTRTGFERLWQARPDKARGAPLLILVVGAGQHGIRDGRVVRAVEAFRRGGYIVVAPEVPMLVRPSQPDEDLARLGRLLAHVLDEDGLGATRGRVALAGVSVGASLLLTALIEHLRAGGAAPRAFLGIGVPFDLPEASGAWFALPLPEPEGVEHPEFFVRDGAVFARSFLWRAALPALVDAEADRERLRAWLGSDNRPRTAPAGLESPSGRAFGEMVVAGPDAWTARRAEILAAAAENIRLLSPIDHAEGFSELRGVRVFLLHGEEDPQVPLSHGERLHHRLSRHTLAVLLRSRMVGHTSVSSVGPLEALEHLTFMDDFLDSAR